MCKVVIDNREFKVQKGKLLSEVLIDNGFSVMHPCGGRGVCGKCRVLVNGKEELSCQYVINSDITVTLPENNIFSESEITETGVVTKNVCFALDIGTTTLALALVSLDENKIIKVATATNPQVAFGADVISRISYCQNNSVTKLKDSLVNEINCMISGFNIKTVPEMYVSGNTTMLHILFGVDPSSMGVAPYKPQFIESRTEKGEAIGINKVCNVISLPCVAAFVGADLVAGINYIGLPSRGKYNLLVDLGTNAEILLFSEDSVLCTSAAAGPCFEGANISCGMSATDGAIYSLFIDDNNKMNIKTISNITPKGICGTGLIDIISELVRCGIIDETGYMDCENYNLTDGVYLSQKDIRQYQLAKSAVYSAIVTLMNIENIEFSQIENMYISGGFSAKINVENATKTGLLPTELKGKTISINNSSLLGTAKFACEKNNLQTYLENARYIDLSMNPNFSNLFIENMEF